MRLRNIKLASQLKRVSDGRAEWHRHYLSCCRSPTQPLPKHFNHTCKIPEAYLRYTWIILDLYANHTWWELEANIKHKCSLFGAYLKHTWWIPKAYLKHTWSIPEAIKTLLKHTWSLYKANMKPTWSLMKNKKKGLGSTDVHKHGVTSSLLELLSQLKIYNWLPIV